MDRIPRTRHVAALARLFKSHPVVAIIGARQVGKSTLAREFARSIGGPVHHFDLEDPDVVARFAEPKVAMSKLTGLVVLDEIQCRPDLFPLLRVLADRPRHPARFLVLGSASPALLRQGSETLAGRIAYHELPGFALDETGASHLDRLWIRGGFPRSFLADSDDASDDWRQSFNRTFLERDLPQLGVSFPSDTMGRLWRMLAHWHGQVWNSSEFGRSFGVADTTIRRWMEALAGALVVRLLKPWLENVAKRQVRSPKVLVADTGLLHALLGLPDERAVLDHPKCGASWESFATGEVTARLGARPNECYFWATHAGAELDLLVVRGTKRLGFEIKRTSGPTVTPSMRTALADLRLDRLDVIHAGDETYELSDRIRAVPLNRVFADVTPLR